MATNIKLKYSSVTGKTPTLSDLDLRELAVNTADGKLFLRKGDGSGTDSIVDITSESDPVFSASAAAGVTTTKISNWDTAYGWGDHASAGYQPASTALTTSTTFGGDVSGTYNAIVIADDSHTHDGRYYTETESDARFLGISDKAADSNLLDGIDSGSFLRSDVADTMSANLTIADDKKLYVGGTGGLEIYHTASNNTTYITETGLGALNIGGDDSVNIANAALTEYKARFFTDGAVELYYDNVKKFETTSGGVSITGNMSVTGTVDGRDLSVDGAKLDGIEAGATADQTKADIDALNIDADTLDGEHGSYYQPASTALTTSTTFGGDVSGTYNSIVIADDSHNHIISNVDGLQSALDVKAPLASPALTGIPTAPTAAAGTNTTQIATTAFVSAAVSNLVDSAPGALDTLNELAAALGDDANFSTTVTNSIATKLSLSGGQMTGNITFSGAQTVDGRDLSVDGAKLDGIESGATADQTAAEIKTAYESNTNTNAFTDAEKTKLSGIAAGAEVNVQSDWNATSGDALILNKPTIPTNNNQLINGAGYITSFDITTQTDPKYLRSDENDTMSGNLTFSNDKKAIFGTGLEISYTSTNNNSIIREIGSGVLNIGADDSVNITNSGLSEYKARFITNGAVELYYDNVKKFETTSGGVSITGNIAVSGSVDGRDLSVDGAKLDGIESGATADQTAAEIKTAYESNADTNAFTDAEQTKLSGIESGATADQTAGEILTAIKTVDGDASGLDADLLDGQHGSYYQPASTALTTSTTFGGDVSGTYDAIMVADDSHNHVISNVDGLQSALDAKAPLASPALTGTPTAPTAAAGTNTTQVATTAFVSTAVSNLVDSAPGALDTLNELAAALGDDANFSTTVTNSIATKLSLSGGQMTGNITFSGAQTVDGRDLSVDGAKLDGIEAGATADQTKADIDALNIDADTLDGQHGSYYQPASTALTTSTTFGGDVSGTYNAIVVADDSHTHDGRYYTEAESDARYLGISAKAADSNLLDGIDSSSFLRSDTADDFSGVLQGNNPGGTYFNLRGGPSSNTLLFRVSGADTNENISSNLSSDYGFNIRYRGDLGGVENAFQIDADNQTGSSIEALRIKQNGITYFGLTPFVGSNKIWHAGNDGSGSGLDADTLDGQQGTYYLDYNNFSNKPTIGNGTLTVSTGGGLSGSGTFTANQTTNATITVSHADTSSVADLTASSRTYVTALTFDTYGHVTGYSTGTETIVDTNTTYGISAETTTGGANLRLTGSDASTDDVKFAQGANISISRTDANTITISGTNTTYSAGAGLDLNGTVFSHTDTSSQASVDNANGTVIQDITLDTFGHITAIGSVDLDTRYYTEAEADGRFLGISAKAADSDLLDGINSSQFLRSDQEDQATVINIGGEIVPISSAIFQVYGFSRMGPIMLAVGTAAATSFNNTNERWIMNDGSHLYASTSGTGYNNKIWTDSNDGSGSGLDSDLLDGQQGSYYLNTSTTFGGDVSGTYNAIVVADDSHTHDTRYYTEAESDARYLGISAKAADSDLLDGIDSSSFLRSDASDTITGGSILNFQTSAGNTRGHLQATDTDDAHFIIATSGGEDISFRDGGVTGTTNMTIRGDGVLLQGTSNTIWHAGNDGSGSGLDADTVDGIQAASFLRSDANDTFTGTLDINGTVTVDCGNTTTGLSVRSNSGSSNSGRINLGFGNGANNPKIQFDDVDNDMFWGIGAHDSPNNLYIWGNAGNSLPSFESHTGGTTSNIQFEFTTAGNLNIYGSITAGNGNTVWHAGNDGSGSGLDADLLDGQQGSYYLNTSTTFGGDVSGTYNAIVVADDSHNHIISNVDGLQTALDAKLATAGGTVSGNLIVSGNLTVSGTTTTINTEEILLADNIITLNSNVTGTPSENAGIAIERGTAVNVGIVWDETNDRFVYSDTSSNFNPLFHESYHPNADKWTTARTLELTGAVTGSVSIDGSGNVSLATTATSDPTLTINGDASGSATFTNLGNATLTLTISDDSHNHVISNVDGLQTALDGKLSTTGKAADSNLLDGIDSGSFLRSDAADTATGLLTLTNGLNVTGGNVGIGITNPQKKLEVLTSASDYVSLGVNTIAETQWTGIHFGYRENNTAYRKSVLAFERIDSAARGKIHILNNNDNNANSATLADSKLTIQSDGNVGIGTANPGYKLEVNGSFAATTKSFVIPHPTKEGHRLRYGSLEGPENGVYARGRSKEFIIELPEYWTELVDPDSITVNFTPIGKTQTLWVKDIKDNKIYVGSKCSDVNYFYMILAERADVEKLEVEFTV